jgi:hypothetical protein
VQEVSSSDRTDFSLGEEPRDGDIPKPLVDHAAIVMRAAEQSLSAPTTTEEQCAQRRGAVCCTILGEKDLQILARGYAVAKMKLDGLAFLNDVTDRDGASLLVRANQIPNEEVPALEAISVLIDNDPEMERQVCVSPVGAL